MNSNILVNRTRFLTGPNKKNKNYFSKINKKLFLKIKNIYFLSFSL